jgi:hypothetical protein
MRIKNQADFYSGLLFTTVGVCFAIGATAYTVGDGAHMGPGYFPLALGVLLAVLGAVMMFQALVVETLDGSPVGQWAWKPLFFILAASLAFGVLLGGLPGIGVPAMGMILAIYALTIIASLAGDLFNLRDALIFATVLAIGSYVAFVCVLEMQIQAWPTFISD